MTNRKIVWESQHLEIDTKSNGMKYASDREEYREDSIEEYGEELIMPNGMAFAGQAATNLSMTPFGVFRMDDDMHPFKQFKLWMGHTNFNLSKSVVRQIQSVDGVELLRIISRYRFIIGIGKAFDTLSVKKNIEIALCGNHSISPHIPNKEIGDKIDKMVEHLNRYKRWSLLVFPNGNVEFTTDVDADFEKVAALHKAIKEISYGILIIK